MRGKTERKDECADTMVAAYAGYYVRDVSKHQTTKNKVAKGIYCSLPKTIVSISGRLIACEHMH